MSPNSNHASLGFGLWCLRPYTTDWVPHFEKEWKNSLCLWESLRFSALSQSNSDQRPQEERGRTVNAIQIQKAAGANQLTTNYTMHRGQNGFIPACNTSARQHSTTERGQKSSSCIPLSYVLECSCLRLSHSECCLSQVLTWVWPCR